MTEMVVTEVSVFYFLLRCAGAAVTAFCLGIVATWLHLRLARSKLLQPIRKLGPDSHQSKAGTPTLGGFPLILVVAIATLAWTDRNATVPWYLASLFAFASIGLVDDLIKIRSSSSGGMSAYTKLMAQFVAAAALLGGLEFSDLSRQGVFVPFLGDTGPWAPIVWYFGACILLVFISNAVNLSDGLDGLVSIPVLLVALGMGILGALSDPDLVDSISERLPSLPGGRGALLLAGSLGGALLAFLWFNAPPARVFMGDTGSLALGGVIGMMGVLLNQQFLLLVMGGVFVLEALSVMLQVGWFKWSGGRRIFRMAPFHHHLELSGWSETQISIRFWITTAMLLLVSLLAAFLTVLPR